MTLLLAILLGTVHAQDVVDDGPAHVGESAVAPLDDLVEEAPPPMTSSEYVDLARKRIEDRDLEGAHIALDQALSRPGADADMVLYLKGVATELGGDPGLAVTLYDEGLRLYPGSPLVRDRQFRKAEAVGTQGRPDEALRLLAAIRGDLDPSDAHKVALVEAIWTLEAGKRGKGLRKIRDALDAVPEGAFAFYQAKARAAIARTLAADLHGVSLDAPAKKLVKRLEERVGLLGQIERQVTAVADLDEPEWVFDGLLTLGGAYEGTGDALLASRRPGELTEDQLVIYDAELAKRVHIVWVKASRAYALGLDTADRLAWQGRRVTALREANAAVVDKIETL